MNGWATNFSIGLMVSLLGTLPLGILNLTIVRLTLQRGLRAAFSFAVACALVEFVYSYVAVIGTERLVQYAILKPLTDGLTAVLLVGLGIYYLCKQAMVAPGSAPVVKTGAFRLGVQLSLLNVAAFPFWTFYTTLLTQKGWVSLMNGSMVMVYVVGITIGTVVGLWVFVGGSRWISGRLADHMQRIDMIMGWVLVGLGGMQAVSVLHSFLLVFGPTRLP